MELTHLVDIPLSFIFSQNKPLEIKKSILNTIDAYSCFVKYSFNKLDYII